MIFRQPLEIYVLWHPQNDGGISFGNTLYSLFCRDYEKPFEASLGIPVYFRFEKPSTDVLKPIDSSNNLKTVVVAFIDENFVIDEQYHEYLDDLMKREKNAPENFRVYPVALTKDFSKISEELNKKNVIRAYDKKMRRSLDQTAMGLIKSALLHEFSRFLLNLHKLAEITEGESTAPPPIRLFISHSKHDKTLKHALKFKTFVDSKSQVKTFFDVHDIAYGYDFEAEIKKGVSECALVVFQSDSYSSREWCRIETITAKSSNCPVVVVNALEKGEKRSFPYLGNVPTIRLNKNFQEIIDLTLEKVLYNLYQKELMGQIAGMYELDINYKTATYPELFDIINIRKRMKENEMEFSIILYPDPPIGSEELKLLNEMDSNLFFITPNQLPTLEILNNGKQ